MAISKWLIYVKVYIQINKLTVKIVENNLKKKIRLDLAQNHFLSKSNLNNHGTQSTKKITMMA